MYKDINCSLPRNGEIWNSLNIRHEGQLRTTSALFCATGIAGENIIVPVGKVTSRGLIPTCEMERFFF